jgi:hypothetical protein
MSREERYLQACVSHWMAGQVVEHFDACGEPDATGLAEAAAHLFDLDEESGPLDQPEHWIWDLAVEAFPQAVRA